MPYVTSMEKTTDRDKGNGTYIHIEKTDGELTLFTSNRKGHARFSWSTEEAHEVLNMLYELLDD